MVGVQQHLPIFDVELDRNNPRIRRFVEGFEGELTDDNIQLALDIGGDDGDSGKGVTSADKLRNSILANRGIMQPIIVCRNEAGRYLCIEGNTRLFIYRQFHENGVAGVVSMFRIITIATFCFAALPAKDYAERVAARGPAASEIVKLMIASASGEDNGTAVEALGSILAAKTGDLKEGVAAFGAKRPAIFNGARQDTRRSRKEFQPIRIL